METFRLCTDHYMEKYAVENKITKKLFIAAGKSIKLTENDSSFISDSVSEIGFLSFADQDFEVPKNLFENKIPTNVFSDFKNLSHSNANYKYKASQKPEEDLGKINELNCDIFKSTKQLHKSDNSETIKKGCDTVLQIYNKSNKPCKKNNCRKKFKRYELDKENCKSTCAENTFNSPNCSLSICGKTSVVQNFKKNDTQRDYIAENKALNGGSGNIECISKLFTDRGNILAIVPLHFQVNTSNIRYYSKFGVFDRSQNYVHHFKRELSTLLKISIVPFNLRGNWFSKFGANPNIYDKFYLKTKRPNVNVFVVKELQNTDINGCRINGMLHKLFQNRASERNIFTWDMMPVNGKNFSIADNLYFVNNVNIYMDNAPYNIYVLKLAQSRKTKYCSLSLLDSNNCETDLTSSDLKFTFNFNSNYFLGKSDHIILSEYNSANYSVVKSLDKENIPSSSVTQISTSRNTRRVSSPVVVETTGCKVNTQRTGIKRPIEESYRDTEPRKKVRKSARVKRSTRRKYGNYLKCENNYNSEWVIPNARGPEDYFKAVYEQWSSFTLPNPHFDLTCRFMKDFNSTETNRLFYGDFLTHNIPCTSLYDQQIDFLKVKIRKLDSAIDALYGYYNNRYLSRDKQNKIYRSILQHKQKADELNNLLKKFTEARYEISHFYNFYRNPTIGWDANFINMYQKQEVDHQRSVIEQFEEFYMNHVN